MGIETALQLTRSEARWMALAAQRLLGPEPGAVDGDMLLEMIEALGVVQIDTISVLERSQYLVLWSRLGAYDPGLLDALLSPRRAVLEYWAHAASILPMSDYPYHRAWMRHHAAHMWRGNREWMEANPGAMRETLEAVATRGPLASADFERPEGAVRSGPWDWHGPKPSRRALEILWTSGELMIHSRRGGQKRYDLRQRVLAEAYPWGAPSDDALPDLEERRRYLARRTIPALGLVTPAWLWDYFRLSPPAGSGKRGGALTLLREFEAEGVVVPATIEGLDEPAFAARALIPALDRYRAGERAGRTTLLSPFDNLIWDRARARALFDYEVCFEAYVPAARRRYGYYCLAILHGDRLIGRIDPKLDRTGDRLIVRAFHLEPAVGVDDALLDGIAEALRSLARFSRVSAVTVAHAEHPLLADALQERLSAAQTGDTLPVGTPTPASRIRRAGAARGF